MHNMHKSQSTMHHDHHHHANCNARCWKKLKDIPSWPTIKVQRRGLQWTFMQMHNAHGGHMAMIITLIHMAADAGPADADGC